MERSTATVSIFALIGVFSLFGMMIHLSHEDNVQDKELIKVCIEAKGEPQFAVEGEKATGFFRGCEL